MTTKEKRDQIDRFLCAVTPILLRTMLDRGSLTTAAVDSVFEEAVLLTGKLIIASNTMLEQIEKQNLKLYEEEL